MKQILAGVLLCVMLAGSLTGCENEQQEQTGESEDAMVNQNSSEYTIYVAGLPTQYFITYEVDREDGTVEIVSKAVDSEGNIYYRADEEYLFIKDGNNYDLYQPEKGLFVQQPDKKYQSSYIRDLTQDFDEYVKKGNVNAGGTGKYIGEDTVAGRACSAYEITIRFVNFEQKYQFAVDKENYICLKWDDEKNISGYETEGSGSFICTRFDTEDIDLKAEFLQDKDNTSNIF